MKQRENLRNEIQKNKKIFTGFQKNAPINERIKIRLGWEGKKRKISPIFVQQKQLQSQKFMNILKCNRNSKRSRNGPKRKRRLNKIIFQSLDKFVDVQKFYTKLRFWGHRRYPDILENCLSINKNWPLDHPTSGKMTKIKIGLKI